MKTFLLILFGLATLYFLLNAYIKERLQFCAGHNPFARICRKCGAHQHQYQSTWSGRIWWSEVYPIGNDPKCKCHKFAEDHENEYY